MYEIVAMMSIFTPKISDTIGTHFVDKNGHNHVPLFAIGCFGAGAAPRRRGPGSLRLGLVPVVATAFFPLINLPNFILASLS